MSARLASPLPRATAFLGTRLVAAGPLDAVAVAVKAAGSGAGEMPLVFDDTTGRVIDLDLRGSDAEIVARLESARHHAELRPPETPSAGRGRPKLGVVAREVTLLPRQWDWLGHQRGGASAALRRLVDQAQRSEGAQDSGRAAPDAAYHFLHAIAGDLPGYEEATRALFAGDRPRMESHMAPWPEDVRRHALRLAFGSAADDRTAPAA
ncbi:DUF2239 family protein [Ancylobacter sp. 6x-1]|uniref:DUF2239 family protein n=1 Tax=Ancylobacter crimeensis TaxID=2579147 RepID=A0ABT0D9U9_9HYPH|nr:DUF2239 family protein [Ancylobacter crimeensis]MCK0196689.1 DUF2239 family protein [Ancylobacter crimeensis]